jgi:thioredoxin 1
MKKALFPILLVLLLTAVGCSSAATDAPQAAPEAPKTDAPTATPLPVPAPALTTTVTISNTTAVSDTAQTAEPAVFGFFYADWCPTCKKMQPMVEQLRDEYAGRIKVTLLNVDDPQTREAAAAYRVWAIPFMVLVKPNADILGQWVGEQREATLRGAFDGALKQAQ